MLIRSIIFFICLFIPTMTQAVTVSLSSTVQVTNAPTQSLWKVECGNVTGLYNVFTRSFTMTIGTNLIPVVDIFPSTINWFCRTSFVTPFGQGPFSNEIPVTITAPVIATPNLTVIP